MSEQLSGAASYRAAQIYDVTVSSGFVWKMRRVNMQAFVTEGEFPTIFINKIVDAMRKDDVSDPDVIANLLTEDELKTAIGFFTRLITKCAVSPKITLGEPTDDEITPEEITTEDFNDLLKWVSQNHASGGGQANGLNKFRGESDQNADARPNAKRNRRPRK